MQLSPVEIFLILLVALMIFGPKRLPEIGKSLGKGIREFKNAVLHIGDDDHPTSPTPPGSTPDGGVSSVGSGTGGPAVGGFPTVETAPSPHVGSPTA
jgi:TatA/E family protein of Tat protein translocase